MRYGLFAAALLCAAFPASAAERSASFRSGGVEFQLPLPAGFCLPEGKAIEAAQLLAAGDNENVTHLTLVPCEVKDDLERDYILLKTPVPAIMASFDRAEFLKEIEAASATPEVNALFSSPEIARQSGEDLGKVLGTRVDLSGTLRPVGNDDTCWYLGGTIAVASAVANYSISVGICVTVVGQRLLSINWYGPDKGSPGVAELLVKAKRLALQMTGKPAL